MATPETVGNWSGPRKEMEQSWELVRILRSGTRAMRDAGVKYTPASRKEQRTPDRYTQRLRRTVLFPIYDRTVRKIASLPFAKPPVISGELPPPLDRLLVNADRQGTSLSSFAQSIYEDAVDRGVGLFLVDNVPTADMSLPEADAIDARPYFRRIQPDNLVGCKTAMRNGTEVVTELRFRNWFYTPSNLGYDTLSDMVEVWTETTVQQWFRQGADTTPDRERDAERQYLAGYRLVQEWEHGFPGIPLVACYTKKVGALHGEPPMEDLAWQNVAHWNSLSMQGEALHYCRSPILTIKGASSQMAEAKPEVGPGATITDSSDTLEVSFTEIAGTSLAAGEVEIKRIEERCMALGMQPLMAVAGPSTATGEVRADTNEKSEAQRWIEALEWAIYTAFEHAATWLGTELPEDFDWTLYRDSSLIAGKATDVPVIVQLMTQRQIPLNVGLRELAVRGVLSTVDDADELAEQIQLQQERGMEAQMQQMINSVERERQAPAAEAEETEEAGETARSPEVEDLLDDLDELEDVIEQAGGRDEAVALIRRAMGRIVRSEDA